MNDYNASSIKVLSEKELAKNTPYLASRRWQVEFNKPTDFADRIAEFSVLMNISMTQAEDWFITRVEPYPKEISDHYQEYLKDRV